MPLSKKNKITILGTGTSTGIPVTGCHCAICSSPNPKNKRLRTSAFIETTQGKNILIDISPDLRQQCLSNQIERIDATVLTHEHADHLHGIDDLRPFSLFSGNKTIPIYTGESTLKEVHDRFPYIFQESKNVRIGGGIPKLTLQSVALDGPTIIEEENFYFFLLPHGHIQTLCFIHNKLGYIVDCSSVPDHVIDFFREQNLDLLIIDCLRFKPHQTHLHYEATLSYIERIAPRSAGLIHFSHHMEHDALTKDLEVRSLKTVLPLFDGQQFFYGV